MRPRFLSVEEVCELHRVVIAKYCGSAGVRDHGLLQSAVAMAEQSFDGQFIHPTICAMAGAYLFHLTVNHAFVDGNKRVGTLACLVFLDLNGWVLRADHDALERLVWEVAAGRVGKGEVVAFVERFGRERGEA